MARPRKNAPATVTAAPAISLADLARGVTEATMSTPGSRKWRDNPFVELLRESYLRDDAGENGVRAVPPVMASQVKGQVVPALRNAAEQLAGQDIGIRIKYSYVNNEGVTVETGNLAKMLADTGEDEREVTVKYLGRPKKLYLDKDQKAEAISHGFVLAPREGEDVNAEDYEPRIDTVRYLEWVAASNEPDIDDDDDDDDRDEYSDSEGDDERETDVA